MDIGARGDHGRGDVYPGTLNLPGEKQLDIIQGIQVGEARLCSPLDHHYYWGVLTDAARLFYRRELNELPFAGTFARTLDMENAKPQCSVVLAIPYKAGMDIFDDYLFAVKRPDLGLLACWEKTENTRGLLPALDGKTLCLVNKSDLGQPTHALEVEVLTDLRRGFKNEHRIVRLNNHRMALSLSVSYLDFLQQGQKLARTMYNRDAINPAKLESWSHDESFRKVPENFIAVDADPSELMGNGLVQPNKNNWQPVPLNNLAAAWLANYILKGRDLFNGKIIQAAESDALQFTEKGLDWVNLYTQPVWVNTLHYPKAVALPLFCPLPDTD